MNDETTPSNDQTGNLEIDTALNMFATNLAYLRKKRELTQEALALEVGTISQSIISKLERKDQSPTLDHAVRLAWALGVTIDELIRPDLIKYDERTAKYFPNGSIKGRRPQPEPEVLDRYENSTVYCYYYSGIVTPTLREGVLTLTERCGGGGKFVAGILETNSQIYDCKLIIEHPNYLYIFGNNQINPERMFTVLHEPRYTKQQKPYWGGIGIVISENSSQNPYVQKILLSSVRIDTEKYCEDLKKYLFIPMSNCIGYEITKDEDHAFYDWQQRTLLSSKASN